MPAFVRCSAAEAACDLLALNGIHQLFCLPGVQNDPFFDALYDRTAIIRPIHTRHEQGAAYMALGAAMATGRPAAFCVVPGPGILNTTAALSTAWAVNAPVLALTGQIPQALIGRDVGVLHELPDQLAILRQLTKWAARIETAAETPALVSTAFRQLRSGRPRPVALECPMDVWPVRTTMAMPETPAAADVIPVDEDAVAAAARLLGAAERPLIVVGGGAQEASDEVRRVAELLQAPVVAHRNGQGVLDSRHPLAVTFPAGHRLWAEADAVLAIGTRLQAQQMQWGVDVALKIVRVDVDAREASRLKPPAVGIIADAASALRVLADILPAHNRKRTDASAPVAALKAELLAEMRERLSPQIAFLDAIRAALPEDGIFVDELTQVGYVARLAFPVYRPRTFLAPGYQGTLGWGYAAALGAKAACPDRPVVVVSGDGGFFFNVQEMSTAVRHGLAVVAVVFNDNAFGNVQRFQEERYNNRVIATALANPDFVKLAESFGMAGERVTSPDALGLALERALARNAPALIEVPVGPMPQPWKYIHLPRVRGAA